MLFAVDVAERPRDAALGRGIRGRILARRARGTVVVWHDLASPPDLYLTRRTGGERGACAHHARNATLARRPHARRVRAVQLQGLERRNRLRIRRQTFRLREADRKYPIAFIVHGGPQVSFQNQWNWRWNAQTFAARGYAHGLHRLPRLAGIRPGVHRFDQPALGRPAVRGPEERFRRGTSRNFRGSTANAPARSAPRTAVTCRTGSRATGPTGSAAS